MAKTIYRAAHLLGAWYIEIREEGRFRAWLQVPEAPKKLSYLLSNRKEYFSAAICKTKADATLLIRGLHKEKKRG